MNPTLAVLSTEKFLPKSINLIGSMNFCEDAEHLFFQRLYWVGWVKKLIFTEFLLIFCISLYLNKIDKIYK